MADNTPSQFAETQYKIEINNAANTQIARAIASGAEKGYFLLPKGVSGKVKLSQSAKADVAKEVSSFIVLVFVWG